MGAIAHPVPLRQRAWPVLRLTDALRVSVSLLKSLPRGLVLGRWTAAANPFSTCTPRPYLWTLSHGRVAGVVRSIGPRALLAVLLVVPVLPHEHAVVGGLLHTSPATHDRRYQNRAALVMAPTNQPTEARRLQRSSPSHTPRIDCLRCLVCALARSSQSDTIRRTLPASPAPSSRWLIVVPACALFSALCRVQPDPSSSYLCSLRFPASGPGNH